METDGADATLEPGKDMEVPFPGGGYIRGRRAGGGDLNHPPSDHHPVIYCKNDHSGHVSGDGAAPRSSIIKSVMVVEGNKSRGDTGGGSGNGGRKVLGGAGGRGGGGIDRELSQK